MKFLSYCGRRLCFAVLLLQPFYSESFVVNSPRSPLIHYKYHNPVLPPTTTSFPSPIHRSTSVSNKSKEKRLARKHDTALPLARSVISPSLSMAVLAGVVLVHECGHYLAARMFDIKVLEFSIGMGPKLFGFRAFGNEFNVRAIPLGGYVRFAGDSDGMNNKENVHDKGHITEDETKWLKNRPWPERALVLSGGVVFNFLLAYLIFLGILIKEGNLQHHPLQRLARLAAIYVSRVTQGLVAAFGEIVLMLLPITTASSPEAAMGGPVRIVTQGSIAAKHSAISLMWFAAYISLNLGVMNALPIPALDGGRLLFILWEAVTGRKVDRRVEEFCVGISVIILFGLMAKVSWSDLRFLFAS